MAEEITKMWKGLCLIEVEKGGIIVAEDDVEPML